MNYFKKTGLLLFVLLLTFSACKKESNAPDDDETPAADGTILSKIDYWTVSTDQTQTIRELVLDANKEINEIKTYSTSGTALETYTNIEKNADGKIVKVSGTRTNDGAPLTWTFEYGSNGKISKRTQVSGSSTFLVRYAYDDSKRLLTVENLNNLGTSVTNRTSYTYSGSDTAPVSYKQENFNPATASTMTTLTYDDKKNPFQAAHELLYYMGLGEFYTRNVTRQQADNGTSVTYEYTYNASGYAVSKKGSNGSGLKFTLINK